MRLKLLLIAIALFVGFVGTSYGQILTFEFSTLAGNETTATSNFKNANLNNSTISRGAGLTASANAERFNATSWALTSIANAVTGNDYMEFTITPTSSYQFSVSSIVIQWQRSGTGNTAIALRSSVDGYAANLDAIKTVTDDANTQTFTFTFAQANSSSSVTYRLYSYAEAAGGTGGPGDSTTPTANDIIVNGAVTAVSTDEVDYANVQFPGTGNINVGGAFNVYAQTYEPGVTEAVGVGTGIVSWIGYSSSNTDPSTASWTWVPATFNAQSGNNDEFVANIGTALPAGTYYYASRFQLNGGPYKYGGFSSGFWNGTTNVNGTLTVNPYLVDWANLQSPSTATITQGSTFTAYGQVYEPGVTNSSASQGSGITVDFGISPIGSNTNPNTWTNWTSTTAIYNNSCGTSTCGDLDTNGIPDNDEYSATTGSALIAGTYYYTFRYSLNGGPYVYGGYNAGGGGFWNGATDVSGVLTVTIPTITTTPTTLTGFTYVNGSGPSLNQTYTVSGTNLSADILLTAPTDYEISTTSGSGFGSFITLTQTSGTVSTTTIYVRLKAGLAVASYNSENIAATSIGATTKNVTCSGSVTNPAPCQSDNFDSGYGNWTGGSGTYQNTTAAYSGNGTGFNDTSDEITTSVSVTDAKSIKFYGRASGSTSNFTIKIQSSSSASGPWTDEQTLTANGSNTGAITDTFNLYSINFATTGNYFLRVIMSTRSGGSFYLDDVEVFCGVSCTPTITTPTAVSITTTTATLGGNITSIGCSGVTVRGIEWSTTSGFANGSGTSVSTSGTFATGVFTQAVTGLPSGTVIYYKAFATNTEGTAYSTQASFTTPITNDLCSGATGLTINAAAKSAVMNGSTTTAPFTEKDVWFSFTPSCSGTHNITVTGFSGDIDIELYSAACPVSKTYFDTSSGTTTTETITNSLTAGTTYYLRVLAFNTTAETTSFTAQVTSVSTLAINNTGSPATGLIITGTSNAVLMGFTTTPNCATSYNLTAVTISKTGTSTTSDISNLRIFYDANSNGIIDGAEASVSGTGIALSNSMAFTLSGQTSLTTTRNYLLVADVSASAVGGNTFIGKITNSTNLSAVLTPTGTVTGTASGNTQTITYSGPEINVTTNTPSIIPNGSTASVGYNTQFAATVIGASTAAKTYRIYNLGSTTLNVSAVTSNNTEFTVTSSTPYAIAPGAYVTFTVTFSPSNAGTRNAVISIVNNDITNAENPYTFNVKGDGTCAATTNTITPTSGPIGTEVTINSAANLTGATVSFNGIAVTVIPISSTQIKFVVPAGATSGNLVTTNALGCSATNAFTVIENATNSCQGGSIASDLFISEVTDESFGSMTYIEIFNGTGASINLADDNYRIEVYNNGSASESCDIPLSGTIANNEVFVLSIGGADSPEAGGVVPNQTEDGCFAINSNDNIRLFKGALQKDQWGFTTKTNLTGVGDEGYTLRRKNTATPIPSIAFDESHWDVIDADDDAEFDSGVNYSDIGTYNFILGTPPTVTIPSYTATCKTATLTISGTEGFTGGNPLTYQWLVSAPNATGWTEITNGTNYSGSSTATLSIANISTVINYQYYCQVRENTNTCYTASNAVKINDSTITWDGANWRDVNNVIAAPTIDKLVIINADYNTSDLGKDSFSACSVVVNSGKTLTITANKYIKIQNDLTVNGVLTIENNGSLVQVNDNGVNTGNITYERNYTGISTYDYTYWSTPVANQNLLAVSPTTKTDKFFSFDAATTNDWLQENPSTRTMEIGKGYIIRAAPFTGPPPGWLTNSFIGVPNNGEKNVTIYWNGDALGTSNLIGNPYPSAIDAVKFLTTNAGVIESTIYFWTNATDFLQSPSDIIANGGTPGSGALAYTSNDYASFNLTGGAGVGVGNTTDGTPATEVVSNKPDGTIAAGQAFFATSLKINPTSTATFNNSMRLDSGNSVLSNTKFFKTRNPKTKTAAIEKHRIWLNLTNTQGAFKQTLVGYITDATNEYDTRFDGETFDGNEFVDFYSINQEKNLVIQGRSLPFDENDQVPLGFRTTITGAFTIKIDQADGVLTNQAVFIEDKLTNTIFDLRSGPFTFNTVAGTFNDRFVLRYTNKTLGTIDLETLENQVLVSNKNKQIKINSKAITIDKVMVYDLLGRLLFKKDKVNSNEFSVLNLISNSETLLVKVTLQNGEIVTRKILY